MSIYLSVIIPAYNEAKRIPKTLEAVNAYLKTVSYPYEIIVVNDGSRDDTASVVRAYEGTIKNLRLIDNQKNNGKGAVVKEGMLAAAGEIRLFMDADNSTSVDQFEAMRPYFKQGYDVVIGSRAVAGAVMDPPQPWYRRIPGIVSNIIIQIVNVPGIWDTQCGFKAVTARAAGKIFTLSRITGWGFDIEMLALARSLKFRIKELPVRWVNDVFSHVKPSAYIHVFVENIKVRWWLFTNDYGITKDI